MRAALALLAAALALGAGGCATGDKNVVEIQDAAHFHIVVEDANRPLLMFLGKDGCALCVAMDPVMVRLAEEYAGRVTVAHYSLMTFVFVPRSKEVVQKYGIDFYPTALLFNKGKEVGRWLADYDVEKYRLNLDRLVPPDPNKPRTTQPAQTAPPTGRTQPSPAVRPAARTQPAATTRPAQAATSKP